MYITTIKGIEYTLRWRTHAPKKTETFNQGQYRYLMNLAVKKIVKNLPTYGIYNSYNKKNINVKKNGHGLKMGIEYNKKFLIGLDIDNKAGPYDGLSKWKELLLKHYYH